MQLYFCATYYHTLIALIKVLKNNSSANIVLWNDIPEYENLVAALKRANVFEDIYIYDCIKYKENYGYDKMLQRALFDRLQIKKVMPDLLDVGSLIEYSDLYFFNDVTPPARYCIYKNIKYHLIEDALDYFVYFDKYWGIKKSSFKRNGIRRRVKELLGVGCVCWGQSRACIDIEVNSEENIKIPKDKIIVRPRKELFSSLSEEQRKLIYSIFVGGNKIEMGSGKRVILLTQPLFKDRFVASMEEQLYVFERIVEEYCKNGYRVFLKPHPRDMADYSDIVQKYDCVFVGKNIPSEMLNYDKDAYFDEAVSITSTAINFLENAKTKRFMTREFVDRCLSGDSMHE